MPQQRPRKGGTAEVLEWIVGGLVALWVGARYLLPRPIDVAPERVSIDLDADTPNMVDTLADTLAFFDGTYWIEEQEEDLKLVSLDKPEDILNEDLSEIFLNKHYE